MIKVNGKNVELQFDGTKLQERTFTDKEGKERTMYVIADHTFAPLTCDAPIAGYEYCFKGKITVRKKQGREKIGTLSLAELASEL